MIVAQITQEQAENLKGKEFASGNIFNPIQDKNGNWIISLTELQYLGLEFSESISLIQFDPFEDSEISVNS